MSYRKDVLKRRKWTKTYYKIHTALQPWSSDPLNILTHSVESDLFYIDPFDKKKEEGEVFLNRADNILLVIHIVILSGLIAFLVFLMKLVWSSL